MAETDDFATVTVLGTGGTIASTRTEDGASPSKDGSDLVEAVPEISQYADVRVEEVMNELSFDMDFEALRTLASAVTTFANDDVDGIVITHGTDTMEESAYYLDLVLNLDIPVVLTGAQRRPDEVSPDGPLNLLSAVRVTASEEFGNADGVYIVFNEEVHAARDVTKVHTSNVAAFSSPESGPVATLQRDSMAVHRQPGSRSATFSVDRPTSRIEMVKSATGVDGTQLRSALSRDVDGIVIEATGIGNVTSDLGRAIQTTVDRGVPVVITSRCHAGSVEPIYGTPGGGQTLYERGAIYAGDFPAHKARLKLALALDVAEGVDQVREYFR